MYVLSESTRSLLKKTAARMTRYSEWSSGEPLNEDAELEIQLRAAAGEYLTGEQPHVVSDRDADWFFYLSQMTAVAACVEPGETGENVYGYELGHYDFSHDDLSESAWRELIASREKAQSVSPLAQREELLKQDAELEEKDSHGGDEA